MLPLEESVLAVGLRRLRDGDPDFYGFAIASELDSEDRGLTAHGTLYKVLERLAGQGLLLSRWEEVDAAEAGRPRLSLRQSASQRSSAAVTAAGFSSCGKCPASGTIDQVYGPAT